MDKTLSADIKKLPRHFLPQDFKIENWDQLKPWFDELLNRQVQSKIELEKWLLDGSELEAAISEDACWRQIKMTCDTENKELEDGFNYFVLHIQPHVQAYSDALNKKLIQNECIKELDSETYLPYLRTIEKNIDLFREENIPLQAELAVLQQQFGQITGRMTIEHKDKEYTLQQATKFLHSKDRNERESVYTKIQERRYKDRETLNTLFSTLLEKRQQIAVNAGFENFRDYKFKELGRFDYSPEDCFRFHEGVKQHVIPLVKSIYEEKRDKLGLTDLKPWDLEAEPEGVEPLRPFDGGNDLLQKSKEVMRSLHPFFADCLSTMENMGHFDLESRKGKAPGGYNCPLVESGAPFIFMNAANQMDDVITMVHEGGHAVHSFLTHPLQLTGFKEYPMEIAEVASMAMELFSMDHWAPFFADAENLKRAKLHQLERTITIFPWIATIDKFQHWIYTNPGHSLLQRQDAWLTILDEYDSGAVDFSGVMHYRPYHWQRQLHLFEVPFYYIEYGIAQLGAIGLWMQYKENPEKALKNYMGALKLGSTKTLPELYAAAGLDFNFSAEHIKRLMDFVKAEKLKIETGR